MRGPAATHIEGAIEGDDRDVEMSTRRDIDATWDRPLDDGDDDDGGHGASAYGASLSLRRPDSNGAPDGDMHNDGDDVDPMADVIRCAVRERTCVPRLRRPWALAWAVLAALATIAIVLGPWFGERLGPHWTLANGASERICTALNHTILETQFQQDGGMIQVPGIGVRLASDGGHGADVVAMARPRLLYSQSWINALLVPAYRDLYPVGSASACYEHQASGTVAMRDGIDGLAAETVLCAAMAACAAVAAFACVYRLLGPPRALAAPYGTI